MAVYFRGLSTARDVRADRRDDRAAARRSTSAPRSGARSSTSTRPAASATRPRSRSGPIVAACGVPFGKMSGRGLGHTGGTLDKLESIPGLPGRARRPTSSSTQVRDVGLAIVGQTADLVPADKTALRAPRRDGDRRPALADRRVDHVEEARRRRAGDRARRQGRRRRVHEDARGRAARSPRRCSRSASRPGARSSACSPTWTSRSAPRSATRSRCARRARPCAARGRPTSRELVLDACARLLALSDLGIDVDEGRRRAEAAVADGSAEAMWMPLDRGPGRHRRRGRARAARRSSATVRRAAAGRGRAPRRDPRRRTPRSTSAPAGARRSDAIDHAVGVVCLRKRGDRVEAGDVLAEVHARDEASGRAARSARCRRLRARRRARSPRARCCSRSSTSRAGCPSCPRSRPSAAASRPSSRGAGSSGSRSPTRG